MISEQRAVLEWTKQLNMPRGAAEDRGNSLHAQPNSRTSNPRSDELGNCSMN
jgi:hypothetical protein